MARNNLFKFKTELNFLRYVRETKTNEKCYEKFSILGLWRDRFAPFASNCFDIDGLHVTMIIDLCNKALSSLLTVFNACWEYHVWPWTESEVVFIGKPTKAYHECSSYRPLTISSHNLPKQSRVQDFGIYSSRYAVKKLCRAVSTLVLMYKTTILFSLFHAARVWEEKNFKHVTAEQNNFMRTVFRNGVLPNEYCHRRWMLAQNQFARRGTFH